LSPCARALATPARRTAGTVRSRVRFDLCMELFLSLGGFAGQ
jgi:hypothetical protein